MNSPRHPLSALLLCGLLLLIPNAPAQAGSATWNLNPTTEDWNTATNWTPATVPNGLSDTATFATSNSKDLSISAATEVNAILFNSGANRFVITVPAQQHLTISGAGITNSSGITQRFIADQDPFNADHGAITFTNTAAAGSETVFTAVGGQGPYGDGGSLGFVGSSSADHASLEITPATQDAFTAGSIIFNESSSAANATITSNFGDVDFYGTATAGDATLAITRSILFFGTSANAGHSIITVTNLSQTLFRNDTSADHATLTNSDSGYVEFTDNATAANGLFINNGATSSGGFPGVMVFGPGGGDAPTAGNATLIANGGANGGYGGAIFLDQASLGGTARIEVFGNGILDISGHSSPGVTVGSIEGDGLVFLGANNLTLGSNNLSTTFAGVIQDAGSITKVGTGNLTLTNANTYTGGTVVNGGILLANNVSGSGSGRGNIEVNAGTLGGSGIIAGAVVVGTGNGAGAFLGPGARGVTPGTLTIRKKLTLKADSTYKVALDSRVSTADAVNARGVRIQGALILFNDLGTNVLQSGTVFTIINNIAAGPISGNFNNLADGSTITVGTNTFQASYEGGDGNDLTLTVVP
jgi:autotransporter-associated beta strand protein